MRPAWHPTEVESPDVILELAARYTSNSRAFVVYRNGTVVFSDTSLPRSDQDYHATLLQVVQEPADFNVREMQLGNFLVRFKGPVAGIVVGDFYCLHGGTIRRSVDEGGMLPAESVVKNTDLSVPEDHYYIGLYARAKLYCDADDGTIVRRFSPEGGGKEE